MCEKESGPDLSEDGLKIVVEFNSDFERDLIRDIAEDSGVSPAEWIATSAVVRALDILSQEQELGLVRAQIIPDTIPEIWDN